MMVIVLLTLPRLKQIIPPQLPSTGLWTPKVVFGHTQLASKDQSHDLFSQPTVWNPSIRFRFSFPGTRGALELSKFLRKIYNVTKIKQEKNHCMDLTVSNLEERDIREMLSKTRY